MTITLEIAERRCPEAFKSFDKMKGDATKAAGENEDVMDLLTQKILLEFIHSCERRRKKPPTGAPKQLLEFEPKRKRSSRLKTKKTDLAVRDKNRKIALEPKKYESVANDYCHGDDMGYSEEEQVERKSMKPKRKSKKLRLMDQKDRGSRNINNNREKEEEKEEGQSKQVLPDMPAELSHKVMGLQGSDINLVIQKVLTHSDMEASQCRMSIPRDQMRYDFLTMNEQVYLKEKDAGGHLNSMAVPLIEPSLEESPILLRNWKQGRRRNYVLSSPWKNVANKNGLKSGDIVQLWSFKVNHKLHLALVKLDN